MGEVLVTNAWADGVFLTRWIFSDRSDRNRDKWQGILAHLPSAGLTEHCLLHSVLFQAQPHIRSGDFDLSVPITWCFLHPHSHNSTVPSLVSAEGVPSSSCWEWLWHFILICYSAMVTWPRRHILSIDGGAGENIIVCRKDVVESILIDVEARYELIYLIADSIGPAEPTVPVSLQNLQSPVQFMPPSGSVCEKSLKGLLQTDPVESGIS